jgi:hypothetical protein
MTPDEYRGALEAIGWTEHGLSRQLRVHETRTRRWGSGREQYPIPDPIAAWLLKLAAFHRAHPPPAKPERAAEWQDGTTVDPIVPVEWRKI